MATTAKGTPYVVSTDLVANYPTVSSDLADHIDDNLTYNAQEINAQTGTTYTFALADATLYKMVTATNAAASTYTVPPQSSVTWVTGSVLRILNQGTGTVTLTPGSGVTLNGGSLALSQYQYAELHRTGSDAWTVTGIASPPGLTRLSATTLTTSASTSVNNVFSSTYENYRITFRGASSTFASIRLRMRASGTDATGTNYRNMDFYVSGNSTVTGGYSLDAQGSITATSTTDSLIIFDVTAPFLAQYTNIAGQHVRDNTLAFFGIDHQLATSYDGFTIYPTAGTVTGVLTVYGYRI